ncbi:protein spindle-F [Drosophila pseudoobscura]|uniref:Protein spindle-F n=1 Tax=Drosophila pseudoobscura pseudoobscura TaxID=46245 RepID=A0A6I8UMV3_DROPS|nr:protein spindle-F [Drosophila pseudoobscura]
MEATAAKLTIPPVSSSSSTTSSEKMNYALQVALQTIKERCMQLQRRVTSMEEENQRLREANAKGSSGVQPGSGGGGDDSLSLRTQVAELQRQKEQLEEHIGMVSNENRRLWSRLSQISKDQQQQQLLLSQAPAKAEDASPDSRANQNLIRSKTFTQHSPNPHLRQKMISDGLRDISLEEIVLDDFGAGDTEMGYPYGLPVEETTSSEPDANLDAKRCMDGLQDLRREALKQQQELSSALTLLESRIALQPCRECTQKAAKKPEMADKSLETDESLNNELKLYHSEHNDTLNGYNGHASAPPSRINIIQEKLKADAADAMEKTCPMCGKLYSSQVSFNAFREHVEMHFIDDALEMEIDGSVERQFEFVSHTVGDF